MASTRQILSLHNRTHLGPSGPRGRRAPMTDQSGVLADVRRGMIPAHIYNDRQIFELERERVFGRAWVFVAHESEIPQAGDYVVRRVLQDSFIVTRDESGVVRAH